jgi:hypothetical protein
VADLKAANRKARNERLNRSVQVGGSEASGATV